MNTTLESYYLSKPEPYQSCLLALKDVILRANPVFAMSGNSRFSFLLIRIKNWAICG